MESLLVNKKDLLNKINSVLDTLNSIKTDIMKDIELDDITMIEDVKESKYKETTKTLTPQKQSKTKRYGDEYESTNGWNEVGDNSVLPNITM